MNRDRVILTVTEIFLACMLVVDSFVRDVLSMNFLTAIIGLLFVFLLVYMKLEPENQRYMSDAVSTIVIIGAAYYIFVYLLGLATGFYINSNNLEFLPIVRNLFEMGCYIVALEMFRYLAVSKGNDSKLVLILLVVVLSLCDVSDRIYACNFLDISDTVNLVGYYVLPSLIKNVALTYITFKVGYRPCIIYRFIFELPQFFLPLIPNTGEYLQTIFNIVVPSVLFSYFYFLNRKSKTEAAHTGKTFFRKTVRWVVLSFAVLFIAAMSGFFKYYIVVVGSGSMTPTILKGDAIMVKKLSEDELGELKVGDPLVFRCSGLVLVHRITKITGTEKTLKFHTKGDFNNTEDSFVTSKEDVIGTVMFKIPKIGIPTVWLKELANF